MKRFKKILGMALVFSLVITQFPLGKVAKAASGEVQTSAENTPKKLATIIPETTADADYNTAAIKVECASDVSFNEYASLNLVLTVNGKEIPHTQIGDSWTQGGTSTYEIKNEFAIRKGDTYKVEAYTDSWKDHTESWVFKVGVTFSYESADTPPSGDGDTSKTGEVQTSGGASTKKLATIIPETTADKGYNTAAVTVQCASDVNFNAWCNLNLVVTVNGKAVTISQKGNNDTLGGTSTYEVKNEFAIKKGDTYKVEAYTDSWEEHTGSWVFKVGVTLGYEESNVDLEQGKLYCGKKAEVLVTSDVSASCNSLTFEVKCAADTSFNPWTSIEFTVIINSKARTYSWGDASDYVFKLKAKSEEGMFTPSGSKMDILPIVNPVKETPKPSTEPSAKPTTEPTTTPGTEPTDAPSKPTVTPSTEPTDVPSEPTVAPSTEPTKEPSLKKGDEVKKSGNIYKVASASAKTVKYVKVENKKKSTITVPATVKVTVGGKSVTYKVVSIADNTFKNDKSLKKITIGSNISTIGKNAFNGCSKLKTIIIKSTNITKIGKNAFKGVSKTTVIKVPKDKLAKYKKDLKAAGFKGTVKGV